MSKTIDQRVVEMRFDNAQFERGVSESMSTLDRLKQALDFSGLSIGVDTIGKSFSAFETIAIGALLKVGEQAVETGAQLVKSLSLDQISAGFDKFGEKTRAVGTLISQGFDLSTVNEQMERLNWFTDETSYNFVDMTQNIGKFTATGRGLQESVTAMEGIALWAALSGQNATVASRAMYQLSQAMGKGALKYDDWKSIQNASMDTKEFREQAVAAAEALGVLRREADGTFAVLDQATGEIREAGLSLNDLFTSDQLTDNMWLSADVMMEVFGKYANAVDDIYEYAEEKGITASEAMEELGYQLDEFGLKAFKAGQEARTWGDVMDSVKDAVSTGWMNTFELIIGDYEQAVELYTDLANKLYDLFAEGGNYRNEILEVWSVAPKGFGGREDLIESFWNIYDAIAAVVGIIREAANEAFTPFFSNIYAGAHHLEKLVMKLKEFTEKLILVDKETGKLNATGEKVKSTFRGIFAVLGIVKDVIVALIKPIGSLFEGMGTGVLDLTADIGEYLVNVRKMIKDSGVLEQITQRLSGAFLAIGKAIRAVCDGIRMILSGDIGGGLSTMFKGITDGLADAFQSLTGMDMSQVKEKLQNAVDWIINKIDWERLKEIVHNAFEFIKGVITNAGPVISGALEALRATFGPTLDKIKAFFTGCSNVDTSGLTNLGEKASTAFEKVMGFFEKVKQFFQPLVEFIKRMASEISPILHNLFSKVGEFLSKATLQDLINVITGFVKMILVLDIHKTLKNLYKFVDGLTELTNKLNKVAGSFKTANTARTLLMIGATIVMLVASIWVLTTLDLTQMAIAAGAITILLGELVLALKQISKIDSAKVAQGAAVALLAVAAALLVISMAIKKLAKLDPVGVATATVALASMLVIMMKGMQIMSKTMTLRDAKAMKQCGVAMIAFAAALLLVSAAVKSLGKMKFWDMAQGILGVSVLLVGLAHTAKSLASGSGSGELAMGAAQMLAFAAAILILSAAVKSLAKIKFWDMMQGLAGVSILLAGLTIAIRNINKIGTMNSTAGEILALSVMIIALAAGINKLAKVVIKLSKLDFWAMAQGLLGVTVLLAEITAASLLLKNAKDGSMAMAIAAAGVLVLALSLKKVAEIKTGDLAKALIGLAAAFVIIGVAGLVLEPVALSIAVLSASLLMIGVGVLAFSAGISILVNAMLLFANNMSAFEDAAIRFADVLVEFLLHLISRFPELIRRLGEAIVGSATEIIDFIVSLARVILAALETLVPDLTERLLQLIVQVLDSLASHIGDIMASITVILNEIIEGFKDVLHTLIDAIREFGLLEVGEAIATVALLETLMAALGVLAVTSVVALAPLLIVGLEMSGFMTAIQPFIDGVKNVDPATLHGAKALAEAILTLTKNEILDALTHWFTGGIDFEEFGNQVVQLGNTMVKYSETIGDRDFSNALDSANALKTLIDTFNSIEDYGFFDRFSQGRKLQDFGAGLQDIGIYFSNFAKSIDQAKMDKVTEAIAALGNLISTLQTINDTKVLETMTQGGKLTDFAKGLAEFGPQFVAFAKDVEGQSFGNVTIAATALKHLVDTLNEIDTGKINNVKLTDLANGLKAFGPGFVAYAQEVEGQSFGNITVSATALKQLLEALNSATDTFDIVTKGAKLKDLGDGLAAFGPGYVAYANLVAETSFGNVTVSATALKSLLEAIPDLTSGDWMTQGGRLKDIGDGLASFGPKFVEYADTVAGHKFGNVTVSATALKQLLDAFSGIIVDNWMTEGQKLKDFGIGLAQFGPEYVKYVEAVNGVESFDKVPESATALSSLITTLSGTAERGAFEMTEGDKLRDFGKGLSEFSEPFATFANTVNGITSFDKVVEASGVIKDLILNFSELQGKDVCGMNSEGDKLKDFGAGLVAFAPNFVTYANEVNNVTSFDKAIESAAALEALITTFSNLKGKDFWGQNTEGSKLADFAAGLGQLGEPLGKYADAVDGKNFDNVTTSATALEALVHLGGELQLSEVDNWAELTSLMNALNNAAGPFVEFAQKMSGEDIKIGNVTAGANAMKEAATAIAGLPEGYLENSAGLVEFANRLMVAGPFIRNFASSISQIDGDLLTSAIDAVNSLLQMCTGMLDFDPDSIAAFGEALQNLGTTGIEGFITAFTDGKAKTDEAMRNLLQGMLDEISKKETRFLASARTLMNRFVDGIKEKRSAPKNEISNAIADMITVINNFYDDFYELGKYMVKGFAQGITDNTETAREAARYMAGETVDAARRELDEHSPSRVFYSIGRNVVLGFTNAFFNNANLARNAGDTIALASVAGVNQAIQNVARAIEAGIDTQPTIRPVLDLSNVRSGMATLNSMISRDKALSVNATINGSGYSAEPGGVNAQQPSSTINFTQNNYSPKALSRLEIYRQTRNQLSMMKGLVRAR